MKKSTVCFIIMIMLFVSCLSASAETKDSKRLSVLPEDKRAELIEKYSNQIEFLNRSSASAIHNFAVSSNGDIAVCDSSIIFKTIDIFDSDGVYKYSYRFPND